MRKSLVLFLVFLCTLFPIKTNSSLDISAKSAVLIDTETGRIIYEKNADERLAMASTTKIITAITAIKYGNLSDVVTVSLNAATTEGSSVWLSEGEKLSLSDLLYAMMLESGNDASVAVAEHIGGDVDSFAKLMNITCKEAGAFSTNCITPSGLDDDMHYTTAKDMAKIARFAMKNKTFREIVSTYQATIPWEGNSWGRTLVNHNKLLSVYDGANGIKTGYTKKSGRCLVSSATKDGWSLIAVTLNASDDWNDHTKMLDYAFEGFKETEILTKENSPLGEINIIGSKKRKVKFGTNESVSVRKIPGSFDYKLKYNVAEKIPAPIKYGEKVGSADILFGSNYYKTIPLYALEEANKDDKKYIFKENYKILLKTLLYLVR